MHCYRGKLFYLTQYLLFIGGSQLERGHSKQLKVMGGKKMSQIRKIPLAHFPFKNERYLILNSLKLRNIMIYVIS